MSLTTQSTPVIQRNYYASANFCYYRKPWIDAESPRTIAMWREYNEKASLPIAQGDEEVMSKMRDIYIYAKKDTHGCTPRSVQGSSCGPGEMQDKTDTN